MKKLLLFSTIILTTFSFLYSQELVVGGDMESADDWTIVDIAAGDGHTETFGYTEDFPTGGSGGCLSLAGNGNWSNVAVCQEITISKGSYYQISLLVKTSMDYEPESHWTEIVVIPQIPTVDADITAYPNSFALNSWDCPDVLYVDGNFADYNCDAKSALMDIIHYEGEGDTTIVLVLKAGGGTAYNVLLDDVSMVEVEEPSVLSTLNSSFKIFPNPSDGFINIITDESNLTYEIYNSVGALVASGYYNGSAIDLQSLNKGVYYISITSQSISETRKIVIK